MSRLEDLSAHGRRALLARLLRERGTAFPLSFAQERLWLLRQVQPDDVAYNQPNAIRLTGDLDVRALERAVNEIVERHETLRTTFSFTRDRPVQIIRPAAPVSFESVDLRGLPDAEREIDRLVKRDAGTPFDLARGPLLRARLLRLADRDHLAVLTIHHIATDGWSAGVILRELAALYDAFSRGDPSPLPPLPVRYVDYAAWQRQRLSGEALETHLAYWTPQLDGVQDTSLPTDRARPDVRTGHGAGLGFTLPRSLRTALWELGRRESATLFMTLLAGFQVMMHRYSGQGDIAIGTPVANRPRPELESLIGYFANTLVLRGDLSGDPSFREVLRRVRRVCLDAYAHQDLPFERLVDRLQPQRNLGRTPLFQVTFALHNLPLREIRLPRLTLRPVQVDAGTAKFDLSVSLTAADDDLEGWAEYSTDIFSADMIRGLTGHFRTLVAGAAADPDRRISRLPLLTEAERSRLVRTTPAPVARPACVHELVAAQAERTPDAVGVCDDRRRLTYAELDREANQLAHELRHRGVGPETVVGVLLERSTDLIVALLGVLKAGGAYLPLDPGLPPQRLGLLLAEAAPPVLVSRRALAGALPAHAAQLVCFGEHAARPATAPAGMAGPDNLAYVIYTSGSTGSPKGVMVTHANVVRLLRSTQPSFGFGTRDVWTFFHSQAFDFSVWEIWGCLTHGGRLIVVQYWVSRSPDAFIDLLRQERVTVLNQTPSALRQLCAALPGHSGPLPVRTVILGGESLDMASLRPWFDRYGDRHARVVNMYGITETTVHVTERAILADDLESAPGSMVGRPIPGVSAYVLDGELCPVPPGVPGELYVGGSGVTRGYLRQPARTAERFVPDPFAREPGQRLYRTGDRARRLPNGDLQYLGRADDQLKIRGHRIEPAEIEAALTRHPNVDEAAVVARVDASGDRRLIAYLVTNSPTDGGRLRSLLETELPPYMLPAGFVTLERLPLTANGKIDRTALAALDPPRPAPALGTVAPRTELECDLARIWTDVLGLDDIGVDDNFFALGADSIKSVQVVARAGEAGLKLSAQQLFRHQTIRDLAHHLRGATDRAEATPAPTRPFGLLGEEDRRKLPEGLEDAYPLTMLQAGMVFHSEYDPASAVYHNIESLHLSAPFDPGTFAAAVRELTGRHHALRTSFDISTFSGPVQLVHEDARIPLQIIDLRGLDVGRQEEALAAWLEAEKRRRFAWGTPPLLRLTVHRRSPGTFQLSVTHHHAVLDGWSVACMVTELCEIYTALLGGRPAGHAEPGAAAVFRDFVALEREAVASEPCRSFWTQNLAGSGPAMLPRLPSGPGGGRLLEVPLPPSVLGELRGLARETGLPLKSFLLGAHVVVISRFSGASDVVTGLTTGGRPESRGGERALGLFLNSVPCLVRLGTGTWVDLARAAFEAERDLLPFRRFPLAELQRLVGRPPFDAAFNFVHFHVYQELDRAGVGLLDGAFSFQLTNLAFIANFSLDPSSSNLSLLLEYDSAQFGEEQVAGVGRSYVQALKAMVSAPYGRHGAHEPPDVAGQRPPPAGGPPEPARAPDPPVTGTEAPRTSLEHTLAEIWSAVLGLDGVGVHEDFFELGGHSLRAIQVVSRVRRAFRLDLSLRTLFETRTIARFAEVIQQRIAAETQRPSGDKGET